MPDLASATSTPNASAVQPRGSRAVDRVAAELKAPIYDTHCAQQEVQVMGDPFGVVRGFVVEISDDDFTISSAGSEYVMRWGDLKAARVPLPDAEIKLGQVYEDTHVSNAQGRWLVKVMKLNEKSVRVEPCEDDGWSTLAGSPYQYRMQRIHFERGRMVLTTDVEGDGR